MEKINRLKRYFKKENIDGYLISKNDEFFEEYVPSYNDRLNYISNFSGSFGFSLILKNENFLFVDGRYTLQAINESGSNFKVITIPNKMPRDFLKKRKITIGFDPKLTTKKNLNIFFNKVNCEFKPLKMNLVDKIWKRTVEQNTPKFYCVPSKSRKDSYKSKIQKLAKYLKKKNVDYQFISACENSAWLLNIRGKDTKYSPIPHSYILIQKNKTIKFFCDLKKVNFNLKESLRNVEFVDIKEVENILKKIKQKKFLVDKNTCSIFFENTILKNNKIFDNEDPIYYLKSIKNSQEINNIKKAHIDDGVALTKYLFWLKRNFGKKKITEISAAEKLFKFRKKNNKFKYLSFPTISGSGPNGAVIHYRATKKTDRPLKKGDIYLVDSGGQYEFGTTDVTRTISLENKSKRIKNIFTRVLKGHIAVANFKLKRGTSGSDIDKSARKFLREIGLDYAHGTGHGVGYYLNVHEGPQAISKNNKIKLKAGMVLSNEPGYYEKNKFGIRIENLIFVKNVKGKNYFENLTLAPIEKNLIDQSLLDKNEINWINNYHKKVFTHLKDKMNKRELLDLKEACLAI